MAKAKEYNRIPLIKYRGKLIKNRNKTPEVDKEFLDWCQEISVQYSSYNELGIALGMKGSSFKHLMGKHNISLSFNPNAHCTPKPYQNREWLFHQMIELNKSEQEVAQEFGWTQRVVAKWVQIFKLSKKDFKNLKTINNQQKELILASLLGDGHISKNNSFIMSHCEKQKDYLFWKYNILKDLCSSEPVYYPPTVQTFFQKKCQIQSFYRFNTRLLSELEELRNLSKRKIIEQINDFELAIYFLDDGNREKTRWSLCLGSIDVQEAENILSSFCIKFNLKGYVKIGARGHCYLIFNKQSALIIDDIILNNIPNNLDIIEYKILKYRR